jgi:hypothetical protein
MTVGARTGKNEAIFREVNERIQELNRGFAFAADDLTDFVCECSDEACFVPVRLTLGEYDAIRQDATHFLISPGHAWHPEVEHVIKTADRFQIVQKRGDAADVAEDTSPPE